jgi:hypothetical protein
VALIGGALIVLAVVVSELKIRRQDEANALQDDEGRQREAEL